MTISGTEICLKIISARLHGNKLTTSLRNQMSSWNHTEYMTMLLLRGRAKIHEIGWILLSLSIHQIRQGKKRTHLKKKKKSHKKISSLTTN